MSGESIDEEIEALLAQREESGKVHAAARKAQFRDDLKALIDLEAEHGRERLAKVDILGWKADCGAATMVIAKRPQKSDRLYKRFTDMSQRARKGDKVDAAEIDRAGELLAESCIVYPVPPKKGEKDDESAYAATMELAPGLLIKVAGAIVTSAMGKADEEGKD